MTPDEWRDRVGARIEAARGRESIRAAARRAGVDEALWRQVELGYRKVGGVQISANPRDRSLAAIARAVGLDPGEVFAAAGRGEVIDLPTIDGSDAARLNAVEERLDRIEEAVGRLLERGSP